MAAPDPAAVFDLLNQEVVNLHELCALLEAGGDPHFASNHNRGCVWACVQEGRCTLGHRGALMILAARGVDLQRRAGNTKTPLSSVQGGGPRCPAAAKTAVFLHELIAQVAQFAQ